MVTKVMIIKEMEVNGDEGSEVDDGDEGDAGEVANATTKAKKTYT